MLANHSDKLKNIVKNNNVFEIHDESEKRAKFEENRTNAGVDKVTRAGPLFQQIISHGLILLTFVTHHNLPCCSFY